MTFLWPFMLVFLLLVPVLVLLYLRLQRRRQRLVEQYGSLGFAPGTGSQPGQKRIPGWRRHIPPAVFLIGLVLLFVSLARPQSTVYVPRVEGTVILLFDVSGSMAADDVDPSRMETAKTIARAFVEAQPPAVVVGVVAFSDSGFAIQAPSDDRDAVLAAIDRLDPQRGTSLAHGIFASLNTIAFSRGDPSENEPGPTADPNEDPSFIPPLPEGTFPSAVIVLLSDGENNEDPDPLMAAQAAAEREVRIHTVGVGSPAGTILEVEGFQVHTRLDEGQLQGIAQMSGGAYHNGADPEQLRAVYESLGRELVIRPQTTEVTSVFAGASILVLLIGGMFSLFWFNRLP